MSTDSLLHTRTLETLVHSLNKALALPHIDAETCAAMAALKTKIEPLVKVEVNKASRDMDQAPRVNADQLISNDLEEEMPRRDGDFSGVCVPTFSVGSPGPPPEAPPEADLIGDVGRTTSVDELLGGLGGSATFDLLAPSPLLPGSTASRASPFVASVDAAAPSGTGSAAAPTHVPPSAPLSGVPGEQFDEEVIRAWAEKHGNLRALLSTLHEVLPQGWAAVSVSWGWEPVALGAVIDSEAALEAYRRAAVVVHPDKLQARGRPQPEQARGQAIFTALKKAQVAFKRDLAK